MPLSAPAAAARTIPRPGPQVGRRLWKKARGQRRPRPVAAVAASDGSTRIIIRGDQALFRLTPDQVPDRGRRGGFYIASRARQLLKRIEANGRLDPTCPYPVQAWRLGELTWIFLGGEVVVDYSLRIQRNLGSSRTWVSSYCNDVMAYIPSKRVLKEGGYEGATAMIYYGQPTAWSNEVEEAIIAVAEKPLNRREAR